MSSTVERKSAEGISGVKNDVAYVEHDGRCIPVWLLRTQPVLNSNTNEERPVVLFLPGHPGIAGLYSDFIEGLYEESNCEQEIIALSYPGQYSLRCAPVEVKRKDLIKNNQFLAKHEVTKFLSSFIKHDIPPTSKIILVGHSAGCYLALSILETFPCPERIAKVLLIFPAIDNPMTTPGAEAGLKTLVHKQGQYRGAVWMCEKLPSAWREAFLRYLVSFYAKTTSCYGGFNAMFTRRGIDGVCSALIDFKSVADFHHHDVVGRYHDKMTLYYSPKDRFAPPSLFNKMKKRFPHLDIKLCREKQVHAFNLSTPRVMSKIVWKLLMNVKKLHAKL